MKVYQTLCIPNTSIVSLFFFFPCNSPKTLTRLQMVSCSTAEEVKQPHTQPEPRTSTRPVWKVRSKAAARSLPPRGSPQEQPSGTEPQHTAAEHAAPAGFHSGHGSPELVAVPARPPGSEPSPALGAAGTAARGWQGTGWGSRQKPGTHLVHVEDEVQLTDILKTLVQRLHEHLRGEEREGQCRAEQDPQRYSPNQNPSDRSSQPNQGQGLATPPAPNNPTHPRQPHLPSPRLPGSHAPGTLGGRGGTEQAGQTRVGRSQARETPFTRALPDGAGTRGSLPLKRFLYPAAIVSCSWYCPWHPEHPGAGI